MGVRFPYPPPQALGPPYMAPDVPTYSDDLPPELKAQLDYAQSLERMRAPEASPEESSPGVGVGRFRIPGNTLDYASPGLLHYLQQQGPAVRPGRGHDLANVLSALGQTYFGSRVAGAEDRQRRHAEDLALAKEQRGELGLERREAHREAASTLARYRWSKQQEAKSNFKLTPEEAKVMGPGYDTATDYPSIIKTEAMNRVAKAAEDQGATLSPRGVAAWSKFAADTGTLPPLGVGKAGARTRNQLLEGAVPFLEEGHTFAGNKADFQANVASIKQLRVSRDGAEAYRRMTTANSNRLLGIANEIKDTGAPWTNAPVRSFDKNVVGAKRMAQFHAALLPVQTEFARLLNAAPGSLAGVLTDEARGEMQAVIGENFTIPMLEGAIQTLQQEAGSRVGSYDQQIREVQERLSPGSAAKAAEQAAKKFESSVFSLVSGKITPRTGPALDSLRTEYLTNGGSPDSLSAIEARAKNRLPRKR